MIIGTFQFENLIRNRVPFHLIALQEPPSHLGQVMDRIQIKKLLRRVSNSETLRSLAQEAQWRLQDPFVFVCQTGQESLRLKQDWEILGYINSCVVEGGWNLLEKEAFR
ncbi:MAG: hypothetical protein WCH11_07420 [Bdellovibrio sp.]